MVKLFFNFSILLVILSLTFVLLTFFAKIYPYFAIDLVISRFIQQINFLGFDVLMKNISMLGNNGWGNLSIVLTAIIFLFLKLKLDALVLVISAEGIKLLGLLIKNLVARPRPDAHLVNKILSTNGLDSFPSGHVLFFIGFYGFLLFLVCTKIKNKRYKILLSAGLVALFVLIGVSRIYLGAHWFSDVLGSYLLGAIWLLFMIHLYQKLS